MKSSVNIQYSADGLRYQDLVEEIAVRGIPAGAVEVYRGRNVVAKVDTGDEPVNIKAFAIPNIVNRYVYGRFRKSKARRSFENSLRLSEMGFNVPAPLAYIEEKTPLTFGRSYFISRHVDGLTELRYPERHPFMRELLEALGREMARLHQAGVWMKDFSPGNVLFSRAPDGSFVFHYVDLNRIRFNTFSRSKLDLMWERLLFYTDQIAIATRAYAGVLGLEPEAVYAEAISRWESYKKRKNYHHPPSPYI